MVKFWKICGNDNNEVFVVYIHAGAEYIYNKTTLSNIIYAYVCYNVYK